MNSVLGEKLFNSKFAILHKDVSQFLTVLAQCSECSNCSPLLVSHIQFLTAPQAELESLLWFLMGNPARGHVVWSGSRSDPLLYGRIYCFGSARAGSLFLAALKPQACVGSGQVSVLYCSEAPQSLRLVKARSQARSQLL